MKLNTQIYEPERIYQKTFGHRPPKGWDPSTATWRKSCLIDTRRHPEGGFYGYVAKWNVPTTDRYPPKAVASGAFTDFLKTNHECACILNHNFEGGVLAWRSDGSLFLEEDRDGLFFEIRNLPYETPLQKELWNATGNFDSLGMSFDYAIQEEQWTGGVSHLLKLSLGEISILTKSQVGAIPGARYWYRRLGAPDPAKRRPVIYL